MTVVLHDKQLALHKFFSLYVQRLSNAIYMCLIEHIDKLRCISSKTINEYKLQNLESMRRVLKADFSID